VSRLPDPVEIAARSMDDDMIADRMSTIGVCVLAIPLLVVATWLFLHHKPIYHIYGWLVLAPTVATVLIVLVRQGTLFPARPYIRAKQARRADLRARKAELHRHRLRTTKEDLT
jgi:hypothetical protein